MPEIVSELRAVEREQLAAARVEARVGRDQVLVVQHDRVDAGDREVAQEDRAAPRIGDDRRLGRHIVLVDQLAPIVDEGLRRGAELAEGVGLHARPHAIDAALQPCILAGVARRDAEIVFQDGQVDRGVRHRRRGLRGAGVIGHDGPPYLECLPSRSSSTLTISGLNEPMTWADFGQLTVVAQRERPASRAWRSSRRP